MLTAAFALLLVAGAAQGRSLVKRESDPEGEDLEPFLERPLGAPLSHLLLCDLPDSERAALFKSEGEPEALFVDIYEARCYIYLDELTPAPEAEDDDAFPAGSPDSAASEAGPEGDYAPIVDFLAAIRDCSLSEDEVSALKDGKSAEEIERFYIYNESCLEEQPLVDPTVDEEPLPIE